MGDAADDVFDSGSRQQADIDAMLAAGCRPCLTCKGPRAAVLLLTECPTCGDCGWLDATGNPCEI